MFDPAAFKEASMKEENPWKKISIFLKDANKKKNLLKYKRERETLFF